MNLQLLQSLPGPVYGWLYDIHIREPIPTGLVLHQNIPDTLLAEAKTWIRQDSNADDNLIWMLIKSAVATIRRECGVTLYITGGTYQLDELRGHIRFPIFPITAITSITYYDMNQTQQTMNGNNYELNTYLGHLFFKTLPNVHRQVDAIEINFTCGDIGSGSDEGLSSENIDEYKVLLLNIVAQLYAHRGDDDFKFPESYQYLITGARVR